MAIKRVRLTNFVNDHQFQSRRQNQLRQRHAFERGYIDEVPTDARSRLLSQVHPEVTPYVTFLTFWSEGHDVDVSSERESGPLRPFKATTSNPILPLGPLTSSVVNPAATVAKS